MGEASLSYVSARQEYNKRKLQYKHKSNFRTNPNSFNFTPKYFYDEKNPDSKAYITANKVKQKFYREQSNNRKLKDFI